MATDTPEVYSIKNAGLFSLSGISDRERIERGLAVLKSLGIDGVFPRPANASLRYLEACDSERLRMFNELLENDSVDALLALRGGFGVTRILDDLDWELLKSRNLPIIGYSDVSALLLAAYAHGCTRLIHGPMLCSSFAVQEGLSETLAAFRQCLSGVTAPMLPNSRLKTIKPGRAESRIFPCNLAMLCTLIGTQHLPSLNGAILALEDICEPAYSVDRMLAHLKSAGILRGLSGLVFGQFTDCEDSEYLPEIFREYSEFVPGPVVSGFPFGHGKPTTSIQVGQKYLLSAE